MHMDTQPNSHHQEQNPGIHINLVPPSFFLYFFIHERVTDI